MEEDDVIAQVIEDLIKGSQQDATRVPPPGTEGSGNPLALLGELLIDLSPGVGDVKALAVDLPRDVAEGRPVMAGLDLLSAIPGIGLIGDLLKRIGGTAADVATSAVRSSPTMRAVDEVIPGQSIRKTTEAADELQVDEIMRQIQLEKDVRAFTGIEGVPSVADEVAFLQNKTDELRKALSESGGRATLSTTEELGQASRDLADALDRQVAEIGFAGQEGVLKGNPINELEFDDAMKSLGALIRRRLGNQP